MNEGQWICNAIAKQIPGPHFYMPDFPAKKSQKKVCMENCYDIKHKTFKSN